MSDAIAKADLVEIEQRAARAFAAALRDRRRR